jgi:hypothetical protein
MEEANETQRGRHLQFAYSRYATFSSQVNETQPKTEAVMIEPKYAVKLYVASCIALTRLRAMRHLEHHVDRSGV